MGVFGMSLGLVGAGGDATVSPLFECLSSGFAADATRRNTDLDPSSSSCAQCGSAKETIQCPRS